MISGTSLKHWVDNFFGYGSWDARCWFISYEESGGDLPEEVADRLDYFSRVHATASDATLCDIRELYQHVRHRADGPRAHLFTSLHDYRFGSHAVPNSVWQNLTAFAFGYQRKPLPDLSEYQKTSFALPSARQEALIRLYPLPAPHNHAWYYSWLDLPQLPFLRSRTLYQDQIYSARINTILHKLSTHRPDLVLLYGMNNIKVLRASVQAHFPQAKFRMVKAVKQHIPQHHRTDIGGTTMLITTQIPALRHQRVETGFDWYAFGQSVGTPGSR